MAGSASREAVAPGGHKSRQARLAGNGASLPRGATPRIYALRVQPLHGSPLQIDATPQNDCCSVRSKWGATRMIQYGVSVLEKDMPFPADCALS